MNGVWRVEAVNERAPAGRGQEHTCWTGDELGFTLSHDVMWRRQWVSQAGGAVRIADCWSCSSSSSSSRIVGSTSCELPWKVSQEDWEPFFFYQNWIDFPQGVIMLHSVILIPYHGLMLDLCTACTPKQTQSHLSPGSPTDFGCLMSYLDSDDLLLTTNMTLFWRRGSDAAVYVATPYLDCDLNCGNRGILLCI